MKTVFLKSLIATITAAVLFFCTPLSFVYAAGAGDIESPDAAEFDSDPDIPALENIDPVTGKLSLQEELPDDPMAPIYDWFGETGDSKSGIKWLRNKKNKRYEYRHLAHQRMYHYDTFQGACASKKYSYHVLYNRRTQKCRVIKVSLKTHKVIRVSAIYSLDHGNDLTYDSKRDIIICVHYGKHPMRLTVLSAKTLKKKKHVNVKIPSEGLFGASEKFVKSIKGITGIGYDEQADEYIVSIQGTRHYMALSPKFKPLRVIKVPKLDPYMRQGMTVRKGFILRSFSADKKPYTNNIVYVFDTAGNYVKKISLGYGYEIESIYFVGKKLYASTYRSYYKKKYKRIRRNGRRVKVAYYVLRRDNNIMLIKKY